MIKGTPSGTCFYFLGLECVPSRSSPEPWWGVHGVKPLEVPKNLHPTVPKTRYKTEQKYLDGCAFFFMCSTSAVQSVRKIPKGPNF